MENQEQPISSIIIYPPDINALLERFCKAKRKLMGKRHRPPKAKVFIEAFRSAKGVELLSQAVADLERQVEKIPAKPVAKKGRPPKR